MSRKHRYALLFTLLAILVMAGSVWAAEPSDSPISRPLVLLLALAGLSLVPFFIIMVTSFVKIAVVLGLVRSALGTQQIPPNPVITGLAMVLSIYVMIPVGLDIHSSTQNIIKEQTGKPMISNASVELLIKALDAGKEPLRDFLIKHSHEASKSMFYSMAKAMRKEKADQDALGENDFTVIVPAFITSELKEAFQIGFIIYLPFVVVDMVVANILLSMGMMMVSPLTISLPFKLLLFVLIDGWHLITRGLILGYL